MDLLSETSLQQGSRPSVSTHHSYDSLCLLIYLAGTSVDLLSEISLQESSCFSVSIHHFYDSLCLLTYLAGISVGLLSGTSPRDGAHMAVSLHKHPHLSTLILVIRVFRLAAGLAAQ